MSDERESERHLPELSGDVSDWHGRHRARVQAVEEHMVAASEAASVLVTRTAVLKRNGVDLRHPERVLDFIDDQVLDAVNAATVAACVCGAAQSSAAVALIVVLARRVAELEGR